MSYRGEQGRGGRGMGPDRGRGGGGGGDRRGSGDRGRGFDRGGPPDRGGFRGRGGGYGGPSEQGGVFAPPGPATIDTRLTDKSEDQLLVAFNRLNLKGGDSQLPPRPDFGKKGQEIKLRTNYFPVKVPKGPLYEYEVSIVPSDGTKARRVKRRIWQLAEDTEAWAQCGMLGTVAHDHSAKLISARPLPQPLAITIAYFDDDEDGPPATGGRQYTLVFQYVQLIDTGDLISYLSRDPQYRGMDVQPIISALNIILAAYPSSTVGGGVMVGQNKFFFPSLTAQRGNLGGGLEAWKGFYSSVRPTYKQLMVNVNVCTTAFYKPGNLALAMIEFMDSTFGARPSAFVRGVRVKTTHLGYKKTVKSVSAKTARQHRFDCAELGGLVTVEQYFKQKYNITLQYPNMPLVDVGGQKQNLLPAEICTILENQPFRGKLTDEHTAEMIKIACKPPNVNAQLITGTGVTSLGYRQGGPQPAQLNAFGVAIGNSMAIVPGRILPRPGIKYTTNLAADDRGSWNLRNVKFAVGARLEKWAVLVIQDGNRDDFSAVNDPELLAVSKGFADMCRASGMIVAGERPLFILADLPRKDASDPTRSAAIGAIQAAIKRLPAKPNLLLVMLSNGDKHIYSGLKYLCDCVLGLASVCVHSSKIRKEKGQLQYFANVALKVNMKMGGVNHTLQDANMAWLGKEATMIVGIDVTHPGPGSVLGTPSIAAVVASVDARFAQFPASLRIQETRKEMVTGLTEMVQERLVAFQERNGQKLPSRIIVFRDGVSEGQFNIVISEEMPLIKEAFKKYSTPKAQYRPKLTIVICGKRHHTRFFPTEAAHADQNGNPKAGTVVDRGVTAVYDFDFFLQAHGGLQGTTKPTHYYVVWDEIGFKADELQTLTHDVSYMFARATKAVSLVSPAYYADLACERGRCYLHKLLLGISSASNTVSSGASGQDQVMAEARNLWRGGVHDALKKTMFYL